LCIKRKVSHRIQSAPELPSGGCATAVGAVGGGELDLGALMRLKWNGHKLNSIRAIAWRDRRSQRT